MARIRTIKPEFFSHEGIFDAEAQTSLPLRIAFVGLWTVCDREGRFKWEPRRLKLACLPYDELDFSRVLDALVTRGFVVKYTVAGVQYGCVPGLTEHQVFNPRESASKLPGPDEADKPSEEKPAIPPKPARYDASSTREARVIDASAPVSDHARGEGKGREGNMEGKEKAATQTALPSSSPLDLQKELWNRGVSFLKASGVSETHARSMIGKWRKQMGGGDFEVLQLLSKAEADAVSEPLAFIEGSINSRKAKYNGKGQHGANRAAVIDDHPLGNFAAIADRLRAEREGRPEFDA